jgi:hypothetical protein
VAEARGTEFPVHLVKIPVRTKNSLFREQQGIACKLLKLLKDSPLRRQQGIRLQTIEIAGRIDVG